jgi:hypothetical protein
MQRPFAIAEPGDPEIPQFWETLDAAEAALRRAGQLKIDVAGKKITCAACGVSFGMIGDFLQHCWSQH